MVKMIEGSGKNKIVQHAHTCSPHEDPYDAKGKNPKRWQRASLSPDAGCIDWQTLRSTQTLIQRSSWVSWHTAPSGFNVFLPTTAWFCWWPVVHGDRYRNNRQQVSCGVSCLTYCSAYIICCSLSFDSVLVALCTVKHGIPAKNLIEINTVVQYEAKKRSVLVSKVKYNVKPYNEKNWKKSTPEF